ncbi:MAG TPA: DUF2589 domain-containing protein [Thermoanaerobaculia bacterium]
MAIDTTPSTVATNALQAIPFSTLIGGPLQAAIDAQTMAAASTMKFINSVGFSTNPKTGERSAVHVTFQYQQNGQMTNLIVPLLAIVPIPYIAVSSMTIDFIANISAAASSLESTSTATNLSAGGSGSVAFEKGPFKISANLQANYSSKSESAASKESKYSVEYTCKLHVEAGQESMPAGLQTVLNILAGSCTTANPNGSLQATVTDPPPPVSKPSIVAVTLFGADGLVVPKKPLKVSPVDGVKIDPDKQDTDDDGSARFKVTVEKDTVPLPVVIQIAADSLGSGRKPPSVTVAVPFVPGPAIKPLSE